MSIEVEAMERGREQSFLLVFVCASCYLPRIEEQIIYVHIMRPRSSSTLWLN